MPSRFVREERYVYASWRNVMVSAAVDGFNALFILLVNLLREFKTSKSLSTIFKKSTVG